MLAATDTDAETEEVPVDGLAKGRPRFGRRHGDSSTLSGSIDSNLNTFQLVVVQLHWEYIEGIQDIDMRSVFLEFKILFYFLNKFLE